MRWIGLVPLFFLIACQPKAPVEVISKTFTFTKNTPNLNVVADEVDPDHYILRFDSVHNYGFALTYKLTEEDKNVDLALVIKGKARTNNIYTQGAIIFNGFYKGKGEGWGSINFKQQIVDLNTWNTIYDSVRLPKYTQWSPFDSIIIQAYKGISSYEIFDLDSVTLTVQRLQ
jgi:hypothetical protein